MYIKHNNKLMYNPTPLFAGQKLIIGIDSSKSNTAFTISDEHANNKQILEFNGKEDGTAVTDTLELCKHHREVLAKILEGSTPVLVGIEDIITKTNKSSAKKHNEKDYVTGLDIHTSRFKITAVFMSLIFFFQENYGITPQLINNWTWKSHTLPAEFRKKEYDKGSLAYFKAINSPLGSYSDDATDSWCIHEYLCMSNNVQKGHAINGREISKYKHSSIFTTVDKKLKIDEMNFIYNKDMSFEENVTCMSNGVGEKKGVAGVAVVDIDSLSFKDIYTYAKFEFDKTTTQVKVWVLNE